MIEIGKTYYEGSGNKVYGVFALIKVLNSFEQSGKQFYEIEFIKNYASKWEHKIPKKGDKTITSGESLTNSFKKAKDNFINSMDMNDNKDIIKYIFRER